MMLMMKLMLIIMLLMMWILTPSSRNAGDYDWSGHIDGDDFITLFNVCANSSKEKKLVFYIGVYTWAGSNVSYVVTATTGNDDDGEDDADGDGVEDDTVVEKKNSLSFREAIKKTNW